MTVDLVIKSVRTLNLKHDIKPEYLMILADEFRHNTDFAIAFSP